jgi:hypothetical protein
MMGWDVRSKGILESGRTHRVATSRQDFARSAVCLVGPNARLAGSR